MMYCGFVFALVLCVSRAAETGQNPATADSNVTIRLVQNADGSHAFEASGFSLTASDSKALTTEKLNALFAVYLIGKNADIPPVAGKHVVGVDSLRFEPQFPLAAGLRLRAKFDGTQLPGQPGIKGDSLTKEFLIPSPAVEATTVIERVYPSADALPENLLRVYIHFSAPMRQGEAYQHIFLRDSNGKQIEEAFLELENELWDREGKRLTVFLNPGRIKKGLQPREELGPILVAGKSYTLEIEREWRDAKGASLKTAFQKRFKATASEEARPDPKGWKIVAPKSDSTEPLRVDFSRPLDHALLQRMIRVVDSRGNTVSGKIQSSRHEIQWDFSPESKWSDGAYELVIDSRIEDRAGNSVARPFEVDVIQPAEAEAPAETVRVRFDVKSGR